MKQINEAVLDAVVREVMPDLGWLAQQAGSMRTLGCAVAAYQPIIVRRYRERMATLRGSQP